MENSDKYIIDEKNNENENENNNIIDTDYEDDQTQKKENIDEILLSHKNVLSFYEAENFTYNKYISKYYNFIDKNIDNVINPVNFELVLSDNLTKSENFYHDINFILYQDKLKFYGFYKRIVGITFIIDLIKELNNCIIYPNLKEDINMEDMINVDTITKLLKSNKVIYVEDYGMKFFFKQENKITKIKNDSKPEIFVDCFINGYIKQYEHENYDIMMELNTIKYKSLIHRFLRDLTL